MSNEIYQFKNWSSAPKMKNQVDSCLKVDIGFVRDITESEVIGYQLTVYRQFDNIVLYRFYVDLGTPNSWCMSTEEAIGFLNQIGFPCQFDYEEYTVSDEVKKTLKAAKDLGYSHVQRCMRPATVNLLKPDIAECILRNPDMEYQGYPIFPLRCVTDYNYYDYRFLKNQIPVRIDAIIEEE